MKYLNKIGAKKNNVPLWIAGLAVLVLVFNPGGILDGINLGGDGATAPVTSFCADDKITAQFNDEKLGDASTDPGLSSALFVGGQDLGDIADDGTKEVPVKAPYEVFAGWNAGSGGTYYVSKLTGNTDCTDPLNLNPKLPLIATSTSTNVVLNDDTTISCSGSNSTMGADEDNKAFQWRIAVGSKSYIGNPELGCNVIVAQYNRSGSVDAYDDVRLFIDGTELTTAVVPAWFPNNGSGWFREGFAAPNLAPSSTVFVDVEVDSDATYQPMVNAEQNDEIYLTYVDCDYDLHSTDNTEIKGTEDDLNTNIGTASDLKFTGTICID